MSDVKDLTADQLELGMVVVAVQNVTTSPYFTDREAQGASVPHLPVVALKPASGHQATGVIVTLAAREPIFAATAGGYITHFLVADEPS